MFRTLTAATALTLSLALPALAQSDDDAAFGERVRAYLMANPEVIMEAVGVLQQREDAAAAQADQDMLAAQSAALLNDGYSWVGGNPDGDITVVEFMDYRCGYCKKAYPEVESLLSTDGNIRFIVKEFPILGEQSVLGAQFAMAAQLVSGDDAYAAVHETLMNYNGEISAESLSRLADSLDLDGAAIIARMEDPEIARRINANRALGQALNISGTPTFVIQDQMVRGYVPVDQMQQLVDQLRS
ncbi:DsbA family protein [Loktanella sp. R86503]|uniref:DsbA family protein n=1 Tax=Loktanella sp. R86503 TaxID=3093847 RepID=UPI0036DB11BC